MQRDVKEFIFNCESCARCKNENIATPGLLQPLPIPEGVWSSISMDFVEGLPRSNGKDMIWVVVDRMSKYTHFTALAHPITAATLAQVFMDQIFKLHGAPANIVSDRDPLFISTFWREFLGELGVEQNLSSSYHPQSDGQSKVINRCLENYLRAFTWQYPQSWSRWLAMAEWWYNTSFHSSINTTPFEIMYGQSPPLHLPYLPQDSRVDAIDRSFYAREEMLRTLKLNLQRAVNRMKQQDDKRRSERKFDIGDWVLLKLQSYRQKSVENRVSDKLSQRYYGPYEVLARVGKVAYTLKLPVGSKVHPTFHVSVLAKFPDPSMAPMHVPEDES